MKKFSEEYFEKKYRILFNKLFIKKGFLDTVKELRKKLGMPDDGFNHEMDLAIFILDKMDTEELSTIIFWTFMKNYARKNNVILDESNKEDKKQIIDAYIKERKRNHKEMMIRATAELSEDIMEHTQMITKHHFLKKNKFLSRLFPETLKLVRKFWALDLLDAHIFGHLVEKYLFLGDYGINQYIKHKIACSSCRYIGIDHFSPNRNHMNGKNEGPFSENYIFNKQTVKLLSLQFNSVFLIIKPYATKEETIQYIQDNWNNMKEHMTEKNVFYKQFDVHPNKIKESDFERNQLIYELYKLSKKELLKMYGGERDFSVSGIYKEVIISAILKEQHNINILPDAIKKSATRFAKDTNTHKKMKDIRDI
jgi:hypothetical protein